MTFDNQVERLFRTCLAAEANYEVWWFYKGHPRSRYIDEFNRHFHFVTIGVHAHFAALVLALSKLFDLSQKSLSIPRLLSEASRSGVISADVLGSLRGRLKNAEKLWSKLRGIRNNAVAHMSAEFDYDAAFQQANLTYSEVGELVELSLGIVNTLLAARGRGTWSPDRATRRDAVRLFETLRQCRKVSRSKKGESTS